MFLTTIITKPLYPPTIIDRPRLYRQLAGWRERRAIVIQAPTGYGKSSLVSRWLDVFGLDEQTAWLTLDESDSDPRRFTQHRLQRTMPASRRKV